MLNSVSAIWFIALGLLQSSLQLAEAATGSLAIIEKQLGIEEIQPISLGSDLQLLGDVNNLSFYKYTGQQNFTTGNPAVDTSGRSLIYYSDDIFIRLASVDDISPGSIIQKITPLGDDAFILSGNGTLLGYDLTRQLLYNLTTLSMMPIFDTSIDNISTVLVDDTQVYFGGNFTYNQSHSVALWNWHTNTTSSLPFGGFGTGSVINSIERLDNDNLLFAGEFFTLDNSSFLTRTVHSSNNSTNMSSVEINPLVSLGETVWTIDSSSEFNSENFICPSSEQESWFETGTSAIISGSLPYSITPTKLRVFNSPNTDNEISLFRITTGASHSILNLTYIEPMTGQIKYCDAFCPLFTKKTLTAQAQNSSNSEADMFEMLNNNSTIISWSDSYQDFAFVNSLSIDTLTFMAMNSYGSNVGLSGIQLYQNSFNSFANATLNEPNCQGGTNITAVSLSDNTWNPIENGVDYVSTHYTPYEDTIPQVEFSISLEYFGEYNINIYTPGCSGDGTCTSRGIVNVTVWDTSDNSVISTKSIYQNNDQLKYDNLYTGTLQPSTYKVQLKYQSGLYASTNPVTVVADRVSVSIVNLDISTLSRHSTNSTHSSTKLNGLLQYQKSNFTSSFNDSQLPITNTSLTKYTVDHFSLNSSVFAALYDNTTLLLGTQNQGVSVLSLNDEVEVQKYQSEEIGGEVSGLFAFGNSIFISGGNLNSSSWKSNSVVYNGTFQDMNVDDGITVESLANFTYGNTELLVINNDYVFNASANSLADNSSISVSLHASGQNSRGEVLLFGDVSRSQFSNINGSIAISSNDTIEALGISGIQPYSALYLNESVVAYAYVSSDSQTHLHFEGSNSYKDEWKWNGAIQSWIYSANQSLMIVGASNGNDDSGSQLSVLDLATMKSLQDITIPGSSSQISSLLNFKTNSTVMVGGDYSISGVQCQGLCLFNYESGNWSAFSGNLVNGTVTDLKIYNKSNILISGQYDTKNATGITLGMYDLTHDKLAILRKDATKLDSFTVVNSEIITWNDTTLHVYSNGVWNDVSISNVNSSSTVSGLYAVDNNESSTSLRKRDDSSTSSTLVLNGQFYDSHYGNLQAMSYDFDQWAPYLLYDSDKDSNNSPIRGFIDQDASSLENTDIVLHNTTTASTTPLSSSSSSSSTTASSTSTHKPKPTKIGSHTKKVHRGFVVLIGLALALGTVMLIGLLGVIFAALFRDEEIMYQPLTPHINDNDLANAQPPEKIMKFI